MSASGRAFLDQYRIADATDCDARYLCFWLAREQATDGPSKALLTLGVEAALILRSEALRRLACEAVLAEVREAWITGHY